MKNMENVLALTEEELTKAVGGYNWGDGWGDEGYFGFGAVNASSDENEGPAHKMPEKKPDEKYVMTL